MKHGNVGCICILVWCNEVNTFMVITYFILGCMKIIFLMFLCINPFLWSAFVSAADYPYGRDVMYHQMFQRILKSLLPLVIMRGML
jgi:hypothetical protein